MTPAEEPRARNNPAPADLVRAIRAVLGIGRGTAIARAIENNPGGPGLAAEVADAKKPFDDAIAALPSLLAVLDTTTANEGMCSACGEWLGRGREGGCESCSEFAQESGWNEYTSSLTEAAEARCVALAEALEGLRAAWNAHMATCPQHAALPVLEGPSWDDLHAWANAPSNTLSAGSSANPEESEA